MGPWSSETFLSRMTCSALFQFVEFVLGILGGVNRAFQARYLMIWEAWCILNSLKKYFFSLITKIQVSPSSFTFMSDVDRAHTEDYSTHIQSLLQSLSLRFLCPSTSHDMRGMQSCLLIEFEEDSVQHNPFEIHRSISELFNFVSLDSVSEGYNSHDVHDKAFAEELKMLHEEMHLHQERIDEQVNGRNRSITSSLGFEVEVRPTIVDVFQFVEKDSYPRLWKESMKLTTLMPTTVCCEQSFSVLKHVMHNNMKNRTIWAKVMTRMYERTEQKQRYPELDQSNNNPTGLPNSLPCEHTRLTDSLPEASIPPDSLPCEHTPPALSQRPTLGVALCEDDWLQKTR